MDVVRKNMRTVGVTKLDVEDSRRWKRRVYCYDLYRENARGNRLSRERMISPYRTFQLCGRVGNQIIICHFVCSFASS